MRALWRLSCLSILFLIPAARAQQQQAPLRDPQAVILLQQSLAAMGGIVPADSLGTGTVTLVAGSKTETGTIHILTRGVDQSLEEIQTSEGRRATIYSRGMADEFEGTSAKSLQLELVVTSQSPDFPLPLLAATLNDPDSAARYVGLESLDGTPTHHVRFWKAFARHPKLQHVAEFSAKDLWLDAASGLPRKLAYVRRAASGAEPGIPLEVLYSDYRNVGGVLYPYRIEKSLNGTPWATISIANVVFNSGLTDTNFPVQ